MYRFSDPTSGAHQPPQQPEAARHAVQQPPQLYTVAAASATAGAVPSLGQPRSVMMSDAPHRTQPRSPPPPSSSHAMVSEAPWVESRSVLSGLVSPTNSTAGQLTSPHQCQQHYQQQQQQQFPPQPQQQGTFFAWRDTRDRSRDSVRQGVSPQGPFPASSLPHHTGQQQMYPPPPPPPPPQQQQHMVPTAYTTATAAATAAPSSAPPARDVPRLYAQRTSATFSPLTLAGVPDSRRTSVLVDDHPRLVPAAATAESADYDSVATPHHGPAARTVFHSLVSCAVPQQAAEQSGVMHDLCSSATPPSAAHHHRHHQGGVGGGGGSSAALLPPHRPSLLESTSLSSHAAMLPEATLEASPTFFTAMGNAMAHASRPSPPQQHIATASYAYGPARSTTATATTTAAAAASAVGAPQAVHTVLIEQPIPPGTTLIAQTQQGQPTQYFLHTAEPQRSEASIASSTQLTAAQHYEAYAGPSTENFFTRLAPSTMQQQQQQQQQQRQFIVAHQDSPAPPQPPHVAPHLQQQQQQQQQQHSLPQWQALPPDLSYTPVSPPALSTYASVSGAEPAMRTVAAPPQQSVTNAPSRPSFSAADMILRAPTRASILSLNEASLYGSASAVVEPPKQHLYYSSPPQQQQQQQQQLDGDSFAQATAGDSAGVRWHPSQTHLFAQEQHPNAHAAALHHHHHHQQQQQQQRGLPLPLPSLRTMTASLGEQTSTGIPPSPPSRGIARRNRDRAVLFVGQLNYEATENDVTQIFSCYGRPLSVVVLKDKGRSTRRGKGAQAAAAAAAAQRKVGGSAFVTYGTTLEADNAIQALHGRYNAKDDDPDHDDETKYLQVSYGQQTGIISMYGIAHAVRLHRAKPENPIPLIAHERVRIAELEQDVEANSAPVETPQ